MAKRNQWSLNFITKLHNQETKVYCAVWLIRRLSLYFLTTQSLFAGILKIYEWFEEENSYILVMERLQPVMDLYDHVDKNGPISETLAKKIFRQV